jgi:hypothetical protein
MSSLRFSLDSCCLVDVCGLCRDARIAACRKPLWAKRVFSAAATLASTAWFCLIVRSTSRASAVVCQHCLKPDTAWNLAALAPEYH